jgi:hypothetical protein
VRLKPLGHLSGVERNLFTLAEIVIVRMAMAGGYLLRVGRKTQMFQRNTILRVAASQVD